METTTDKLRNALSPIYGLAQMVLLIEESKGSYNPKVIELIINTAKQTIKNKSRIDKLLIKLEE